MDNSADRADIKGTTSGKVIKDEPGQPENSGLKQAVKFSLIGAMNTGLDFGVFTALTELASLDPVISHVISYSCGVINSYFFNRRWTFRKKDKSSFFEFAKFCLVNLVSLSVSTFVLYIMKDYSGINLYISKLAATVCSLAVNFTGSRLIVFKAGH